MKVKFKVLQEFDVKTLHVSAGVRYWEDAKINGIKDEQGDLMPCRNGEYWEPIINIETGQVTNWEQGKVADIHYKICDDGTYTLKDKNRFTVLEKEGYVIDMLSIGDSGYGDYIILNINEDGFIADWECSAEKIEEDFIEQN